MAACSGATRIPLAVLRQAKRAGCPAFDQANRVRLDLLLQWLFGREGDSLKGTDWSARLKRSQALRSELETAKRRGELVDAVQLGAALMRGGHAMKSELMNAVTLAPVKLAAAGGDVAVIRETLREILWGTFERFRDVMAPYLTELDAHTASEARKISNPTADENTPEESKMPAADAGRTNAPTARRQRQGGSAAQERTSRTEDGRPSLGKGIRAAK
jgi:hypothetical protein